MRRPGKPAPGADREPAPDFGVDRAAAIGSGIHHIPDPVPGVERPPASAREPGALMATVLTSGESPPMTPFAVRGEHAPPPDFGVDRAAAVGSGFCAPAPVPVVERPHTSVRRALVLGTEAPSGESAPKELVPLCGDVAPEATSPVCGERAPGTLVPKSSDAGDDRAPTTSSVPVGSESQVNLQDRLSALQDDLLLLVLVRLPFDEAVRTSVLAHRWRPLWTQLRTLMFREDPAAQAQRFHDLVHGALARHAGGFLDSLCIEVFLRPGNNVERIIATWLRLAAPRVTGIFRLSIIPWQRPLQVGHRFMVLDVPCFQEAEKLILCPLFAEMRFSTHSFNRLARLVIVGARFTQAGADLGHVVSTCCPFLRILELFTLFGVPVLRIHCNMLIELRLGWTDELSELKVVTPELIKMALLECSTSFHEIPAIITAPKLKILDWRTLCPGAANISGCRLKKFRLSLEYIEHTSCLLENFSSIDCIDIVISGEMSQEIVKKEVEQYRLPDHRELLLSVEPNGLFGDTLNILDEETDLTDLEDAKEAD